jgi:glycine/D-amino acid oxidase-like deaminating enzyme
MSDSFEVIVCGAGIAGVSAAYFLAKAGRRDILLIDEGSPLALTSSVSTECYRNWWPDTDLLRLMNRSIDLMDELADASNDAFSLNRRGYLYVTAENLQGSGLIKQSQRIADAGAGELRVHSSSNSSYKPATEQGDPGPANGADLLLGSEVIRKFFPYVTPDASAALHVRRAGWLSAQRLGMYLLEQARLMGVKFRSGRVEEVRLAGHRVTGVTLGTAEQIDCTVFVNAAGPFLRRVGAAMGMTLPVETELHLKAVFEDPRGVVGRGAPLLIWSDSQQLPWEDEERALLSAEAETQWLTKPFAAGAHTRPEGQGASQSILMLWDYKQQSMEPVFPPPLDDQYPEVVLRGLATMLPGLRSYFGRAPRAKIDGGYYVKTPENRLLVGPTPIEGVFVLGALSGYGIMSACGAGELLAAYVTGSPLPAYAASLALSRYEDSAYLARVSSGDEHGEL